MNSTQTTNRYYKLYKQIVTVVYGFYTEKKKSDTQSDKSKANKIKGLDLVDFFHDSGLLFRRASCIFILWGIWKRGQVLILAIVIFIDW